MRPFVFRTLVHSSGAEIPLLCMYKDHSVPAIEYLVAAMPVILKNDTDNRINGILKYSSGGNGLGEVEKYFFNLQLSFDISEIAGRFQGIFIQNGTLHLKNLRNGAILTSVNYSGINPQICFKPEVAAAQTFQEMIARPLEPLHLVNRFTFRHPENPEVLKEYELTMPLKDLFIFSGFNPDGTVKYYNYLPAEMEFEEVVKPAVSKNKLRGEPGKTTFLEQDGRLVNPQSEILYDQKTGVSNILAGNLISNRYNNFNFVNNGLLLSELSYINLTDKPDLPLNETAGKKLYKDRLNKKNVWYQDEFSLMQPAPGSDFNSSPFKFLFHVKGLDASAKPVLECEISLTIDCKVPAAAAAYDPGNLKKILKNNLSVTLALPFTDNDGMKRYSDIVSSDITVNAGHITAKFLLNNAWARIAYAAMSSDNVISEKIKIKIAYLFNVYTKVNKDNFNLVSLHKIDKLQLQKSVPRDFKPVANVFITSQNTLLTTSGLSLKYDGKPTTSFSPSLYSPSLQTANLTNITPVKIEEKIEEVEYKTDALLCTDELEVFFSCADYGEFYQEERDGVMTPVGCREPYKLGEAPLNLYTEIEALHDASYFKVLRSTQVPNRFVLVPKKFVITRNNKDDPKPFLPSLILYSTFEVDNPTASHALLQAKLQPDIPHYKIAALEESLRTYTAYAPDILLINEVEAEKVFQWTLPSQLYLSIDAILIGNIISYSLTCGIEHALTIVNMVKATSGQGISGVLNYKLPDGKTYQTAININIAEVEGPWMDSPLLIASDTNSVSFENILNMPIDIAGFYSNNNMRSGFTALNMTVAPSGKAVVPVTGTPKVIPQYLLHSNQSGIDEVHTYIEDINCSLTFIDSSGKNLAAFRNIKVLYSLADDVQYLESNYDTPGIPFQDMLPMPLTKYLNARIIRYKLQASRQSENLPVDTPWQQLNLSSGNIVDLSYLINTYFI